MADFPNGGLESHDAAGAPLRPACDLAAIGRMIVAAVIWLGSTAAAQSGDLRPSWSPAGDWIVFQSTRAGSADIYKVRPDGSELTRLTFDPARDAQPDISPDGRRIVFVSDRDRDDYTGRAAFQLYVMNADGSDQRRLTASAAADFLPRWSPDGERIALLSDRSGRLGLYLVDDDGSALQPLELPESIGEPGNPTWSHDGRTLAFDALVENAYDLFSVDIDSRQVVPLTRSPETEWYPAWSRRRAVIVFGRLTGSRENGSHQLVIRDLSTGVESPLTRPTPRRERARDWWPSWSPNGERLVFASRRDEEWHLVTIRSDGSDERLLLPADAGRQGDREGEPAFP